MSARRSAEEAAELRRTLLEHARSLVRREGPEALTMRRLAAEAGCALGLPYKVFESREDLAAGLVELELRDLSRRLEEWAADAGRRTVGRQLDRWAEILFESGVPALLRENQLASAAVDARMASATRASGILASLERTVPDYLRAEQRLGRIRADADPDLYGFLVAGAVHNLLVSGPEYHRPSRAALRRMLDALAADLAP